MTTLPHPTLFKTLTFTGFLFERRTIRIEDRERRCRWAWMVYEAALAGIDLHVEAAGRAVRLHRTGGPSLEFDQGRTGADLILGYDDLRFVGGVGGSPHADRRGETRWALRSLRKPTAPPAELDAAAHSIAYSSKGAWVSVLLSAALGLRPAVHHRRCPAHTVVHRLATAGDGWTVRHGLAAVTQVAVWKIVTARSQQEAESEAAKLRERLAAERS